MTFNSYASMANKWRQSAYASLARARDLRARIERGEAFAWQIERVAIHVRDAIAENRIAILYRSIAQRGATQ